MKPIVGRILVVEDDVRGGQLMEALLRLAGHDVVHVTDGPQALAVYEGGGVDLVVLDVLLPGGMGGLDVCRRIRSGTWPETPVVVTTALTDRASRVEAKAAGADDFLTKPIDDVELRVRVHNLLRVKAWYDLRERQREAAEAALDEVREQLLRAERLATLGTMAAGVGHELKNLAMILQSAYDFIRERADRGEAPEAEDIEQLGWVLKHLTQHGRHLLSLGRPAGNGVSHVDVGEAMRATVELLRAGGRTRGIDIELERPREPVVIAMNRARLEQVLVNLILNAADALGGVSGRPRRLICATAISDAGDEAICSIADTGAGMPPEVVDRVFDPFFTTKPPDRGTGLGMPVVKQIIESHGGRVSVESARDEGTIVRFALPLAKTRRADSGSVQGGVPCH